MPPDAGVLSTRVDTLVDAARWLIDEPRRGRAGWAARARDVALDPLRPRPVPRRLGPAAGGGSMRIAMISEHASPLAVLGGEDAGGQNTHVAELSAALAGAGPRRARLHPPRRRGPAGDRALPRTASTVVHVPAGPAEPACQGRAAAVHGRVRPLAGRAVARRRLDARRGARPLLDERAGRAAPPAGGPACRWCRRTTRWARSSAATRAPQDTSPAAADRRTSGRWAAAVDRVVAQCQDEVGELVRMGVPRSRMARGPVRGQPGHVPPRTARPRRASPAGRGS